MKGFGKCVAVRICPRICFCGESISKNAFRWFESVYRPEMPEMHLQNFEKLQSRKKRRKFSPVAGYSPLAKIRTPCACQASLAIFGRQDAKQRQSRCEETCVANFLPYIPRERGIGRIRCYPSHAKRTPKGVLCVAGVAGFGPTNARVKVWCLTAWLYPNIRLLEIEHSNYTTHTSLCQEFSAFPCQKIHFGQGFFQNKKVVVKCA